MAIIPSIPSMTYITSKAEHISGMIVRLTKVPLNVIFFNLSIIVLLLLAQGNRLGAIAILQRMR